MKRISELRERRTPAFKCPSNGRKLLNRRPPEVANSYWSFDWLLAYNLFQILQIYSASIIEDQLADLQSRGFRAAKLSFLKTSELKECRVEIILCSAEETLTKEFTSELKSSSLKLHQPSLWINRILCKHVNFKKFSFQSKSGFEFIDQCS